MTREERYKHYYNEGYNAGSTKGYEQAIKKIKELATEYFSRGEITEKVYNAMMNYTVSIND